MKSNKSFKAWFIIIALSASMAGTGCAQLGTYMKDRGNDLADCFKLDVGLVGGGAEMHARVTDALVTGFGAGAAIKVGFKGRHFNKGGLDVHVGLPISPIYWFLRDNDSYKEFPITYYGLVGNIAWPANEVKCIPGSYEAESIVVYSLALEQDTDRDKFTMRMSPELRPEGFDVRYANRPRGHPFQGDLINSFDIEFGGTVGLVVCASVHVGFSPGQFLDFLLGWFGVDIGDDDSILPIFK